VASFGGITASGDVYAGGDNVNGQIGNGTTTTAPAPVQVESGQTLISATASDLVTAPGG
jgi:Regulator of chromosome condensation (RCC1) repeat